MSSRVVRGLLVRGCSPSVRGLGLLAWGLSLFSLGFEPFSLGVGPFSLGLAPGLEPSVCGIPLTVQLVLEQEELALGLRIPVPSLL